MSEFLSADTAGPTCTSRITRFGLFSDVLDDASVAVMHSMDACRDGDDSDSEGSDASCCKDAHGGDIVGSNGKGSFFGANGEGAAASKGRHSVSSRSDCRMEGTDNGGEQTWDDDDAQSESSIEYNMTNAKSSSRGGGSRGAGSVDGSHSASTRGKRIQSRSRPKEQTQTRTTNKDTRESAVGDSRERGTCTSTHCVQQDKSAHAPEATASEGNADEEVQMKSNGKMRKEPKFSDETGLQQRSDLRCEGAGDLQMDGPTKDEVLTKAEDHSSEQVAVTCGTCVNGVCKEGAIKIRTPDDDSPLENDEARAKKLKCQPWDQEDFVTILASAAAAGGSCLSRLDIVAMVAANLDAE